MHLLFYLIYALFLASEIAISRRRAQATDTRRADSASLFLLWVVIVAGVSAGIWTAFSTPYLIDPTGVVAYGGLGLMVLGMVLRWSVVWALGRRFTADVAIRQGHTLKTDGPYRYLRHPSYAALLLIFLGLGFSLNNWLSLLLVLVPATAALLYRIRIEEAVLLSHFGSQYQAYQRHTKALIPFVY